MRNNQFYHAERPRFKEQFIQSFCCTSAEELYREGISAKIAGCLRPLVSRERGEKGSATGFKFWIVFFFLPGLGRTKIWACLNMVVNHQILGYHGIPYFRQTHIERNVLLFWWHGRRPVPQPSGWCSGWRRFSQPGWDGNAKCLEKPQVVKGSTNPSNKSSYPLVIKHDIHGGFFIKPCLIVGGTESTLEGNIWAWFDQTFWWVRTS